MVYAKILNLSVKSNIVGKLLNKTNIGKNLVTKSLKKLYGEQVGKASEYGVRVFCRTANDGKVITTALDKNNKAYFENVKVFNDKGKLIESATRKNFSHAHTSYDYEGSGLVHMRHTSWRDADSSHILGAKYPVDVKTSRFVREYIGTEINPQKLAYNKMRDVVETADLLQAPACARVNKTVKDYKTFAGMNLDFPMVNPNPEVRAFFQNM